MSKNIIKKIQNYLLKKTVYVSTIPNKEKAVYLTFDDGPEPRITEFVLEELAKYNFKATFFCRGDNAEKHPELLALLREQGHIIGNHSYSHHHAYKASSKSYLTDVEKADAVLHTFFFRPPHGSLTIKNWLGLRHKYRIVYWSLNSGDSALEHFYYQHAIDNLKAKTKFGDIVLFHFCHLHEKGTRLLLPDYLKWLADNQFKCGVLPLDLMW
jgi:peptidoglycan/xylan/chitin deacetylase (PgdA/CDA1 family)